jgi:hypothetical protein
VNVTTDHPETGYGNNVAIIEKALREKFGLSDNSHVMTAVAAHIWSKVCGKCVKTWSDQDVREAIHQVECRVGILKRQAELLR